ncbi:MAG: hypothetical protein OEM97_02440 [Acidimicrobiia bacterium]|nr:hypothetical protein [Acidimicrobiia bacterium]
MTATFLQVVQIRALGGGLAALLSVGESSAMRPLIESELGNVAMVPDAGHDGQTVYLIARDPLGRGAAPTVMDHAGFRYRRILYPALGGLGGILSADATVLGLTVTAMFAFGFACAGTAALAMSFGLSDRLAAAAVLCPGLWLSVQLLTVDALAVGLALSGLALFRFQRFKWALTVLVLATLAKDQMLLIPLAAAAWSGTKGHTRNAALLATIPTGALLLWSTIANTAVGAGFTARGNLDWPFRGLAQSIPVWPHVGASDRFLAWFTVGSLAVAVVTIWLNRSNILSFLLAPWVALAAVSSNWVWELGNNVARVYAVTVPLVTIGIAAIWQSHGTDSPSEAVAR